MTSTDVCVTEYRRPGQTDLEVSILGFGSSPLGNVFGTIDPEEGNRAVHLAIDRGINFFDVSPYYGLTLAEDRLGKALAGKRSKILLATKCGRYGVDRFDFSAKRVTSSIDESLKRLATDYVTYCRRTTLNSGTHNRSCMKPSRPCGEFRNRVKPVISELLAIRCGHWPASRKLCHWTQSCRIAVQPDGY